MGGSIIKAIKSSKCGWDGKELQAHSHKGLMKCLYKSNVELFRASQEMRRQDEEFKNVQAELGKMLAIKQEIEEDTGLMKVEDNGETDAKNLLEAEPDGTDTQ